MGFYVAGFDGGGTKTALEIRDETGTVLAKSTCGAMNLNGAAQEVVMQTLADCFAFLQTMPGGLDACRCICMGTAGISNAKAAAFLRAAVQQCGYKEQLLLVGDQETALVGALGARDGAILIAGTGSICYGCSPDGRSARTGGRGHLIDDEGSGYAIGRDVLRAVVRAQDKRGTETQLTASVYQALNIQTIEELVEFVYAPNTQKKQIAALAPLCTQAAQQGDVAAHAVLRRAAEELVQLVIPVITQLNLQNGTLALLGSVVCKDAIVQAYLRSALAEKLPALQIVSAKGDAACGAAQMALCAVQP